MTDEKMVDLDTTGESQEVELQEEDKSTEDSKVEEKEATSQTDASSNEDSNDDSNDDSKEDGLDKFAGALQTLSHGCFANIGTQVRKATIAALITDPCLDSLIIENHFSLSS